MSEKQIEITESESTRARIIRKGLQSYSSTNSQEKKNALAVVTIASATGGLSKETDAVKLLRLLDQML